MKIIYTSGIVPYTITGLIGLQKRGNKNKKHNENYAFFGGKRDLIKGKLETAEQTMLRESYEELKLRPDNYEPLGEVKKDQGVKICYQETYMVLVNNINDLTDYEGLGIEAFTLKEARELKMNPKDELILDQIENYFYKKNIKID